MVANLYPSVASKWNIELLVSSIVHSSSDHLEYNESLYQSSWESRTSICSCDIKLSLKLFREYQCVMNSCCHFEIYLQYMDREKHCLVYLALIINREATDCIKRAFPTTSMIPGVHRRCRQSASCCSQRQERTAARF
jgi:hypothetical protein